MVDSMAVRSSASAAETEASARSKLNWLRAGVLGANDGIVSVAGVVIGVAAATPGNIPAIATAGVAALVAGAFSMAGGEYVSVSTQRDTEKALLGLRPEELTNPWNAAASSFVSFFVGALLPLVAIILAGGEAIWAAVLAVVVGLIATGWISSALGKAPRRPAILRNVIMGSVTMGVTYLIGLAFGVAIA